MERFVVGDVVVTVFPFSDLSSRKRRPAVVLAKSDYNNLILCQITSFKDKAKNTIQISESSFVEGSLPLVSYARPDKLFTTDPKLINRRVGRLNESTVREIKTILIKVFDL